MPYLITIHNRKYHIRTVVPSLNEIKRYLAEIKSASELLDIEVPSYTIDYYPYSDYLAQHTVI